MEKYYELMIQIDHQFTKTPFYGSRKMTAHLRHIKYIINRKKVRRLMRAMGIIAIYPKPKLSIQNKEHKIYPYLLRNLEIVRPNQVWSTDISYIPTKNGHMYLVAIIDWYSRKILSWRLSNTLETAFCIDALNEALTQATPEIFNTDQGCQFTSCKFTQILKTKNIKISMDSKGRALDNIIIERFWRSIKYEKIYLNEYESGKDLRKDISEYIDFYNNERPHQSLGNDFPDKIYNEFNNSNDLLNFKIKQKFEMAA